MQAINLLRHDGPRATLIERRPRAGEGLAYGDAAPSHLLNVRAKGMHAYPDDPDGFVRWLERQGYNFSAECFVPRLIYGDYLRDLLACEMARKPGRLTLVQDEAVALTVNDRACLTLRNGGMVAADLAILAVGNLPPYHPPGFNDTLPTDVYIVDPWVDHATAGLTAEDTVLIIGTGLTMVDTVLRLKEEGFEGRIVAISRRGLLPHRHSEQRPFTPIDERPAPCASSLVRSTRMRAAEIGWHNAVDELRRFTQPLWRAADHATRARFLRHLRPWWDIHRHRLAPIVADQIAELIERGRLSIMAARIRHVRPFANGVYVTFQPRGAQPECVRHFRRALNCTGPQGNLTTVREPLLRHLYDDGTIRPDPLRIGIDIDAQSRTFAADGTRNERLYAIGPMTRSESWEIVAVPDIRRQVWALAQRLSNAHWVGGEGL